MSRARRSKRRSHGPPFVQLQWFVMDCPAWRGLSAHAQAGYAHLARRYNGSNNGQIAMSVRELADRLNCSKDTASRTLIELEDAGFISTETMGKFTLKNRKASTYRLTVYRDDRNGHPPTKEFMANIPRSDRKDRTVRQEGHRRRETVSRSGQKDRGPEIAQSNGPTEGTLIESHHGDMVEGLRPIGAVIIPVTDALRASRIVRSAQGPAQRAIKKAQQAGPDTSSAS